MPDSSQSKQVVCLLQAQDLEAGLSLRPTTKTHTPGCRRQITVFIPGAPETAALSWGADMGLTVSEAKRPVRPPQVQLC